MNEEGERVLSQHERRGVSLGTVFMLLTTLVVIVGCSIVLPRMMGSFNISMEDRAMQSSMNLNDALPELAMNDIPLSVNTPTLQPTVVPPVTAAPAPDPTAVPAPPTAAPVSGTVVLTFGGSINMDVLTRKSGFYNDTDKYDFTENLALIAAELDSDCTLVTLEAITDPDGNVRQIPNAPDEVMDMLAAAHVDVVALGYSRAFERGLDGASATISQAQQRDLETLGLYDSPEDAARLRIIDVEGVKVAYLHYGTALTNTAKRNLNRDGTTWAQPVITVGTSGAEQIAADIRLAREQGAHIVVVSLNWSGSENLTTTSTKMKTFMQALADAGADVIVGAGTKAVREVSWIIGNRADGSTCQTLCAWSLGSLLNGERNNGNVTGMLLHVKIGFSDGVVNFERVSYTPTYIWRFRQDDYYRYRVVASDLPAPDGMDETQAANAARAFENLRKTLGNSPVILRTK